MEETGILDSFVSPITTRKETKTMIIIKRQKIKKRRK